MWQSQTYVKDEKNDLLRVPFLCTPCSPFWHLQPHLQAAPCLWFPLIFILFFIRLKGLNFFPSCFIIFVNHYSIYFCFFSLLLFQFLTNSIFTDVSMFSMSVINFFSFCSFHSTSTTFKHAFFFCYCPILTHSESVMKVVLILKCK